jgi:putative phosphoribosyl transferase
MLRPLFRNRRDAGRRLAAALAPYGESRPVVLALPRGGVPVGFEVAKALAAPLDVLLVRKIGAPGHEELGLGAVVDGHDPQLVLNEDLVRAVARRPSISRQRNSGNWPRLNVAGSTISAIARLLRSRAGL